MRHAERVAYDDGDGPLSSAGMARAQSLAHALKDAEVTAIYISSMLRTAQTAAPLAKTLGLTPVVMPGSDKAYADAMLARLRTHTSKESGPPVVLRLNFGNDSMSPIASGS